MQDWMELTNEMEEAKEQGLYTWIRTLEGPQGAWLTIQSKKVLNLSSNNYLGLANHPAMKQAAIEAIQNWGVGPGAVRTIAGTMSLHNQLEERLAAFKKVEAVIMLQSGFTANQAVLAPLVGAQDALLSDELNHASIIDGTRLTKAMRFVWKHKDMVDLREQLRKAQLEGARRKIIITDGVFSMDGDIAPLPEIVALAKEFEAIVLVDDAHGEGVLGSHGRGIVDHYHLHGEVDIEVGTLSKAFGVIGGFVAGKKPLIDYLKQKARPFLFSSSLSPADTAAAIESVKILESSDELVKKLWENAEYFRSNMTRLGFDTGHTQTPITPVMLYEAPLASQFSRTLFEKGVFAQSLGFPTVPKGKARIRVIMSAAHSKEDLDYGIRAFEEVGKELGVLR
ncbi:MAG TPA: glycine C-acetyltransferase [Thermotogota bacterium]|jgi:glycine C-acetyltransferase|nr:glycine C-acetyltransferase [Thermotogota bacterium]NLH18912.1 glycine C-acetyltransferase [Thermotogaceae bacterium]OQC31295.1 MAG: putative pyridoxal phosphate-dependent acyltransferase [Thermotogota bacterium ADurb.Bin062]HNW46718.1 glycine C-acetyltransferase [Thermotogota bacterium]HNY82029.1 glycine C-acetyltransferase [Thermotogota bacterium]